jgi:hypothetical protein
VAEERSGNRKRVVVDDENSRSASGAEFAGLARPLKISVWLWIDGIDTGMAAATP